jgi:hypothetical protein
MPLRAVPLKLVKAPPITILPSDWRANACTGAFAPVTPARKNWSRCAVGVENARAVAFGAVYVGKQSAHGYFAISLDGYGKDRIIDPDPAARNDPSFAPSELRRAIPFRPCR